MDGRRLPALGERGGGWVVLQMLLIVWILVGAEAPVQTGGVLKLALGAIGIVLIFGGLGLVGRASIRLGPAFTALPRPIAGAAIVESGPYRLVRHPIYGGLVIAGLGWSLFWGSVVSLAGTVALFVLLDLKGRREEAWLLDLHPDYETYRRGRRRMIPFLY